MRENTYKCGCCFRGKENTYKCGCCKCGCCFLLENTYTTVVRIYYESRKRELQTRPMYSIDEMFASVMGEYVLLLFIMNQ